MDLNLSMTLMNMLVTLKVTDGFLEKGLSSDGRHGCH